MLNNQETTNGLAYSDPPMSTQGAINWCFHQLVRRFGRRTLAKSDFDARDDARKSFALRAGAVIFDNSSPLATLRDLVAEIQRVDPSGLGNGDHAFRLVLAALARETKAAEGQP